MNPQYKEINDLIKQEIAEIREIDNFRKDELTRQYKYTRIMVMFVGVSKRMQVSRLLSQKDNIQHSYAV